MKIAALILLCAMFIPSTASAMVCGPNGCYQRHGYYGGARYYGGHDYYGPRRNCVWVAGARVCR